MMALDGVAPRAEVAQADVLQRDPVGPSSAKFRIPGPEFLDHVNAAVGAGWLEGCNSLHTPGWIVKVDILVGNDAQAFA